LFLAATYQGILKKVAEHALIKAELHLSTKFTYLKTDHQSPDSQQSPIEITTANGATSTFDEVVMTAPLGWLKRNTSAFNPPLPLGITNAIDHISYGRLEKVYLAFATAFWLPEDSNDSRPFSVQFLPPTYIEDSDRNSRAVECVSLASLPEPFAHPTLLFYLHGPCAQHVTSRIMGLDPSSSEYYSELDIFFAPYYSRLPGYDKASASCRPERILATDWQNDECSGWGSYTTFQTSSPEWDGEILLDKDIEALREGCPERGLWFAGEHTAPFVALGTTSGAYWSGEKIAERIATAYYMD